MDCIPKSGYKIHISVEKQWFLCYIPSLALDFIKKIVQNPLSPQG